MPRILPIMLAAVAWALCWTAAAADPALDSKAWGKVNTTNGPARSGALEEQLAKQAGERGEARGVKTPAGARELAFHSIPTGAGPEVTPAVSVTSRIFTGAELAACEARIRAKVEASRHASPAPGSVIWPGPLSPKPAEKSTSIPFEGEALARSLAAERGKTAAPPRPASAPTLRVVHPGVAGSMPPATRTVIPGTPQNDEQRAKLERARAADRAGAVAPPPRDRP
jgi:hypothetical protein